ncbi:hypothetical protein Trydic_g63 [Trypoxylus dichotomus]
MGSPLSPIIANIFTEDFESRALDTIKYKPKLLKNFLSHLNIRPKIKFTMEHENRNQLPFLDILVIKRQNDTLGHTIYRKTIHIKGYPNTQSLHHPA